MKTAPQHYSDFGQLMEGLRKKGRKASLLLGNGFSMAYDPKIFSYNALANFVETQNDPVTSKLFSVLKTKNFEVIMRQLTTFKQLLAALDADATVQDQITHAHDALKQSLLVAVKSLHPEHVFKVPEEKVSACASFLKRFTETGGDIFSSNYDLLLYWVQMRSGSTDCGDGFGRELDSPLDTIDDPDSDDWSELRWGPNVSTQKVFHLHGTLPLFDTGTEVIKEQYSDEGYLLENVNKRIGQGQYPIFVAAGSSAQKLAQIRSNRYLANCYDRLSNVEGSLVTFGFSFGESDDHIISALNKASRGTPPNKLLSVYVGVYSDGDAQHIAAVSNKFRMKLSTFDAKTANLWG